MNPNSDSPSHAHAAHDPAAEEALTEVRYGETDQMGYAHHATAVLWLEYGRVTWLRKRGLSYRDLESQGVLLPVVNLSIKYHAPGRFEDQLVIRTTLKELSKSRVWFESHIYRTEADASRKLLVTGNVELACVDRSGRVQRVPEEFQAMWKLLSGTPDAGR